MADSHKKPDPALLARIAELHAGDATMAEIAAILRDEGWSSCGSKSAVIGFIHRHAKQLLAPKPRPVLTTMQRLQAIHDRMDALLAADRNVKRLPVPTKLVSSRDTQLHH